MARARRSGPEPVAADGLSVYWQKRDFAVTREPSARKPGRAKSKGLSFAVQKHAARRLHYDLRLEWQGTLKSWALTRGPSLDPAVKRLAVEVEDHPLAYGAFEGAIPAGEYGGGTVQLWDRGVWEPERADSVAADLAKGHLSFTLRGARLRGDWSLVRMRSREKEAKGRSNWLLIKSHDAAARPGDGDELLEIDESVSTGRTMAEIAGETSGVGKARKAVSPNSTMPDFVAPQLCQPVERPPAQSGWVHEVKLDGYRMQLRVENGVARLRTRSGLDWTSRFPAIAAGAAKFPDCLLDGEVVVLEDDRVPDFAALQAKLQAEDRSGFTYFAFDLLCENGRDLRGLGLTDRKHRLAAMIAGASAKSRSVIRFLAHLTDPGDAILKSACRMQLEGIVSKRADARYVSGRGAAWTKAKCRGRDDFLIGGWTPRVDGKGIGALLVGTRRQQQLVYVGRVGSGFDSRVSIELRRRLEPLARNASPFDGRQPPVDPRIRWVVPQLVAETAFGGWTGDGILRHAVFKGLRDEANMKVTARHAPPSSQSILASRHVVVGGVPLTHPERVLWPADDASPQVTKLDLARYYERNAEFLLAHAGRRLLSVVRAPEGIAMTNFFQRHASPGFSALVQLKQVSGQSRPFLWIRDAAGLVALAQMNVVELHPWGAPVDDLAHPDRLIFDLDPGEGVGFQRIVDAANELRQRLAVLKLAAFAKTSGGKGLHVVVPLLSKGKPRDIAGWEDAKSFSRLLSVQLELDQPAAYTTTLAKRARVGRIFLDYLRNDRMATAVAPWSPRARPGAPVAVPLAWSQVRRGLDPRSVTINTLMKKRKIDDPWSDFASAARPLRDAIKLLLAATSRKSGTYPNINFDHR